MLLRNYDNGCVTGTAFPFSVAVHDRRGGPSHLPTVQDRGPWLQPQHAQEVLEHGQSGGGEQGTVPLPEHQLCSGGEPNSVVMFLMRFESRLKKQRPSTLASHRQCYLYIYCHTTCISLLLFLAAFRKRYWSEKTSFHCRLPCVI